ncbi:MAG TPA: M1 family metallopeptidase [Candidatus Krumholzibacteria bacterium]|nr:M1 family metallopeptidase [Candidatus Krumholzibacteria bacterium]HPD73050.1 M1 family metallopeptidase [Candidatus Krumholzibacteria bacterium]HRY41850.1 M1 family metallopeptidase [Candidatus Krumholzibacteria bacterium]
MSRFDPHSWCDADQPAQRHLDLELSVDFVARTLRGKVRLHLAQRAAGPLDLDARSLAIESVRNGSGAAIPWAIAESEPVRGDRLRVDLPAGTDLVEIVYTTAPGAVALGWLEPQQTAGGRHPFLFSQCQPIHARTIVPCQDTPRHRVTYDAAVTVPAPLRAVMSAGAAGETHDRHGRTTWRFRMPQAIPTYLLALAVGNLDRRDLGPRSCVYAEPETVERAAWEFAEVESMIASAETLFGPYEWDRFDLLLMPPAFPYGGMENPRLTFLTPTLLAGDRSQVNVVAHELAHSWTGNLVTNATMNDFWLNEGFTVYAERRILEEVYGKEYADLQGVVRRNALQVNLDHFGKGSPYTKLRTDLAGVDPDEVYSLVPYEKGAQFVLLVENAVGRARFDRFLRAYIDTFRFRSITTDEFLAFLEQELPGVYARVEGPRWVDGPDMPDNELPVVSARVDRVRSLAAGWACGARPTRDDVDAWSPTEWQLYLQDLPRQLGDGDCHWLDETFRLTKQGNYEVLVEWLTIAAGSNFAPALPRIREVLSSVGRMKYLKPLYTALMKNEATQAFAREVFAEAADSYHPLSKGAVAGIVKA